jgi:hypothetical protein
VRINPASSQNGFAETIWGIIACNSFLSLRKKTIASNNIRTAITSLQYAKREKDLILLLTLVPTIKKASKEQLISKPKKEGGTTTD